MRKGILFTIASMLGAVVAPAYADPRGRHLPAPYDQDELPSAAATSQPKSQGKPWARKRKARR